MRISLLIKTIQPDQSNPKQHAWRRWFLFFSRNPWKKSVSFTKWLVRSWPDRPVLTFGKHPQTIVVCHLHRQTGRSTVSANGKQNFRLVNFVSESRFPYVPISYIYRKTVAKAWYWYQRWLWRRNEHEFPFAIFHPEKQDYLFRDSVSLGNFPLERLRKSYSIYFPTGFSGNLL